MGGVWQQKSIQDLYKMWFWIFFILHIFLKKQYFFQNNIKNNFGGGGMTIFEGTCCRMTKMNKIKEANMPQFRVLHVGSTELVRWRHTCVQSSGPTLHSKIQVDRPTFVHHWIVYSVFKVGRMLLLVTARWGYVKDRVFQILSTSILALQVCITEIINEITPAVLWKVSRNM